MSNNDLNMALLSNNIMDLADLPSFKTLNVDGTYRVQFVKLEGKEVQGVPSIEASFIFQEAIEIPGGEECPMEAGDECSFLYMLQKKDKTDNELAQGQLKKYILLPFLEAMGCITLLDVNEKGAGAVCDITVKSRPDTKNPEKRHGSIVQMTIIG